jgi:hypothetical protein
MRGYNFKISSNYPRIAPNQGLNNLYTDNLTVNLSATGPFPSNTSNIGSGTGPQGPQGPIGIPGSATNTGATGLQGPQGIAGIIGTQGSQGSIGPQGLQGITGPLGTQGIQGPQGLIGVTGPQGLQGIPGSASNTGATGLQGPQGVIGIIGPQGNQGITGPIGIQGIQGPQGVTGIIGPQGNQGITGSIGNQGMQGPQGSNVWNQNSPTSIYFTGNVGINNSNPTYPLDIVGTLSMNNSVLFNPIFTSYKESIFIRAYSGTFSLNCSTGNNFNIILSSGANSISFTNFASSGTLQGVNLFVQQDSVGNRTLNYPSSVSWGTAGAPTLSTAANAIDVLNFITWTGGSKILGFVSGKGF